MSQHYSALKFSENNNTKSIQIKIVIGGMYKPRGQMRGDNDMMITVQILLKSKFKPPSISSRGDFWLNNMTINEKLRVYIKKSTQKYTKN